MADRATREADSMREILEQQQKRVREAAKHYDENRQTAFAFEAEDERRQAEANRRYWDRRLAKITEELEAIEEDIFSAMPAREKIERIYRLRSGLLNMRHAVAPMIEICNQLRRHDFPGRTSAKPATGSLHGFGSPPPEARASTTARTTWACSSSPCPTSPNGRRIRQ